MSKDNDRPLIRFDWAMKRLLRDKANFAVLEGFLTTLLGREIRIARILESESNQDYEDNKFNRVDILAESSEGEKMLIEVQNQSEVAYFHRMLFGTSRLISEYAKLGESYGKISKIYSINIVYFNLGEGDDSVYVGETRFFGLHDGLELNLPAAWKKRLKADTVSDIFPVYYILRVDEFDKWSRTPLDQWLYYLSHGRLGEDADAPGMDALQEKLRLDSLSREERLAYEKKVIDQLSIRNGYREAREEGFDEGFDEGKEKGLKEGRAEGLKEGFKEGQKKEKISIAIKLREMGMNISDIMATTGLSADDIPNI